MRLSIIIPVYNTEKYLYKCLSSCITRNLDDVEIIIVNDGSLDNSQNIIDDFCAKYTNIRCITQNNQGLSIARNNGLDIAKGDYIWFIDSDDWIEQNSIDYILSSMEGYPDVISIARVESNTKVLRNFDYFKLTGTQYLLQSEREYGAVFYICKRSFLNRYSLRFFPGIYHEDMEFVPRMLYLSQTVVCMGQPLYNVTINPASITRTINPKKSYDLITVAQRLLRFKETFVIEESIRHVFDLTISIVLNNAWANIVKTDKHTQQQFDNHVYNNRSVLRSLSLSTLKYKVEFVLFCVYPRKYTKVYSLLQKFNIRKPL